MEQTSKYRILYVDDEEKNLSTFKITFKRYYDIFTASSPKVGLEIIRNEDIHLVITDQRMPEMTGVEFLGEAIKIKPEVVRMILTGYSDIEAIMEAVNKYSIHSYITKPWDNRELKLSIDNALEKYRLKMDNQELILQLKDSNKNLETKVKERTKELEKKNEELAESNKIKDKLFSIISHDLRSPLSTLSSFLNLFIDFQGESFTKQEVIEIALKIQKSIKSTSNLLDNLLQWALSRTEQMTVNLEKVDLFQTLQENIELFKETANFKKISITSHAKDSGIFVKADTNMLDFTIRNLINNAIKFTHNGGKVHVSVLENEGEVFIEVKDTGIGMTPQQIASLFDGQMKSSLGTDNEKGTGIGLPLCKEFVNRQGGAFKISSTPGQGSVFRFSLPIFREELIS